MNETREELHKGLNELQGEILSLGNKLTGKIDQTANDLQGGITEVRSELKSEMSDFRTEMNIRFAEQEQRFGQMLAEGLVVIRTDIENFKIVIVEESKKESQLQRYQFRQDMEEFNKKMLKEQREEFNTDIIRHMSVLGEEYQWRLSAVGEKVDLTWEKCERKYFELEQKDMTLADKVALLEEYLPVRSIPRRVHKGKAQSERKRKGKKE